MTPQEKEIALRAGITFEAAEFFLSEIRKSAEPVGDAIRECVTEIESLRAKLAEAHTLIEKMAEALEVVAGDSITDSAWDKARATLKDYRQWKDKQ
jgi:hypothetical protein